MKPTARVSRTLRERTQRNRIAKARLLDRNLGGPHRLAQMLALSHTELEQMIGYSPSKAISDDTARRMERVCGVSEGWLDL